MEEKFKEMLFKCFDSLVGMKESMMFVDAYQDNRALGGSGAFLEDIIPNVKVMYTHNMFYNMYKDFEGKIVVFCQLTNAVGKMDMWTKEDRLSTFFGVGYNDRPCTILFMDVPFELEQDLFIVKMPRFVCEYKG